MPTGDAVPTPLAFPSSPVNVSDMVSVLRDRAPRLAMAFAAGQMLYPMVKALRAKTRERTRYTIKVPATDDIYYELHEWVLGLLEPKEQRALVAWTRNRSDLTPIAPMGRYSAPAPPQVRLRYDGTREQSVTIGGHRMRVVVADGRFNRDDMRLKPEEIVFTVDSEEAKQQLLLEISRIAQRTHEQKRQPMFRMLNGFGDWERLDDLPDRSLESVILPDGQLGRLIADVDQFLASEADYVRRCIPYHRGHLYEGPPGTGKTSVARAIASYFGMDVWYLPLSDIKRDSRLLQVLNQISPRSMLLLEDVDVFHAATQRNDEANTLTLSGLLNALDGIATPHGLLTVMTTNKLDTLDDALVRPGRVDLLEHFQLADADQVSRLLSRWYDLPINAGRQVPQGGIAPSDVVEICKRNKDVESALSDLLNR